MSMQSANAIERISILTKKAVAADKQMRFDEHSVNRDAGTVIFVSAIEDIFEALRLLRKEGVLDQIEGLLREVSE